MQYQKPNEDTTISYSNMSKWHIKHVVDLSISSNNQYIVVVSKLSEILSQLSLFQIKKNEDKVQFIQLWEEQKSHYKCQHILFFQNNKQFIVGTMNSIEFFRINNNHTVEQTQTIKENRYCVKLLLIEQEKSLIIIDENSFHIWRNNNKYLTNFVKWQFLITKCDPVSVCVSQSEEQIVVSYFNKRIILFKKIKNHKWMLSKKIRLFHNKISLSFVHFLNESQILLKQDLISINQWKNKIIRKLKIIGADGKGLFNNQQQLGYFVDKQTLIIKKFERNNFNKITQKLEFRDKIRQANVNEDGSLLFVFFSKSAQIFQVDMQKVRSLS